MRPALANLQRALSAAMDPEGAAWLARGLRTWLEANGNLSLCRCLGLPAASRLPVAMRDFWLAAAAVEAGLSPARLYRSALAFDRRTWPVWRDLPEAPARATAEERLLFAARKWAPFPKSRRQYSSIVRGLIGKPEGRNASPTVAAVHGAERKSLHMQNETEFAE